jgi:TPR repeat protein
MMNDEDLPKNDSDDKYSLNDLLENYHHEISDESMSPERWIESAERGNAEAQCNMGYCYRRALGVKKNNRKAVEWYQKAAQGHARAQNNLGYLYEIGDGVRQNYALAAM